MMSSYNKKYFKQELGEKGIIPFIGVYDVFSASIVAKHYNGIILSGFGFAAIFYGLPDFGFISWSDMVGYIQRVKAVLPNHFLLVDMDDGYGDSDIAGHLAMRLESAGVSGVVLEDQKRPRRCGHFDGKQLLPIKEYFNKLKRVLDSRSGMFVVARTDAVNPEDMLIRAEAYAHAGADAVLVDGMGDFTLIKKLRRKIAVPVVYNQIAGGKAPLMRLTDLKKEGISIVIYSTPCLSPTQAAVEKAMRVLKEKDWLIKTADNPKVDLEICVGHLRENQLRRKKVEQRNPNER